MNKHIPSCKISPTIHSWENPNFHIPRSPEKSCGFEDLGEKQHILLHIGSSWILHSLSTVYSLHFEDYPKLYNPSTVKLGNKEHFDKEQIGIKELIMDYQPFYTINLLLDKELLPI